ncbi:MAG TPA: pyridoxal phosphate-dependent aminotransferase, partial [Pseudobdellovibrionaceae bacterium]|nr:pyridoxal phosphate-dependent aminotransferase [Pseudobdellovibrionaceae bacterium]
MISQRMQNIKMSPTLALVGKVKEMQEKGFDVISLTVGEPDWQTYSSISEAGIEAINKGITKYTPPQGTMDLRKKLITVAQKELGLDYKAQEVVVASGSKLILYSAFQALCNPGDEVIVPAPYWVSYTTLIEMSGALPKIIDCGVDMNFKMTPEALEKAITPKTKVLLFCSPSNPTGLMYSKNELQALAEVLKRYPQVFIISDDIYNRLVFDGSAVAPHLLHIAPEMKSRILATNGGSKSYAMTGWRIGWAFGPQFLTTAIADFQSQAIGSPSSIAQYAVQKGIDHCDEDVRSTVKTLMERRTLAMEALSQVKGMTVYMPDGAFYLWCDISSAMGKKINGEVIQGSGDFCRLLLE